MWRGGNPIKHFQFRRRYQRRWPLATIAATLLVVAGGVALSPVIGLTPPDPGDSVRIEVSLTLPGQQQPAIVPTETRAPSPIKTPAPSQSTTDPEPQVRPEVASEVAADDPGPELERHRIVIAKGDSLYLVFQRQGFPQRVLAALLASKANAKRLKRLHPGDEIDIFTDENQQITGVQLRLDERFTWAIARENGEFVGRKIEHPVASSEASATPATSPTNLEIVATKTVRVERGDSLYLIFKHHNLAQRDMLGLLQTRDHGHRLKRLQPGQDLSFSLSNNGRVERLEYDLDDFRAVLFARTSSGYTSRITETPVERRTDNAFGTVKSSLFLAGQDAGLSDNLIMQMVEIFGWDVDFALDIRRDDRFSVVYDEIYKNGEKLRGGTILAAEFINQGRVIRAHRGVDYAASRGTPVKASGDGKVRHLGRKGDMGRLLSCSTVQRTRRCMHICHVSQGACAAGSTVRQGQTIGYIGSTGLATGPHLHYEFRVRGVHRNPVTVKLPHANPINPKYKADFLHASKPLVAQLDLLSRTQLAANF